MSDNTKDWANIRIEEPVRDDARDDPRTYTEVMEAGLTFNVDPSTVRRFMDLKAEVDDADPDVPDMTVQMFLESLMDTWRAVDDGHYSDDGGDVDPNAIADAVAERLEGSKPLEDMAFDDWFEPDYAQTIAHHVSAEVDTGDVTLEADERTKIAREVAGMLR